MDNNEHAIFSLVNELGDRYGLKPCDFVAAIRYEDGPGGEHGVVLDFEGDVQGEQRQRSFGRMLQSLGLPPGEHALWGSSSDIYDALESALAVAPKSRLR